MCTDPGSQTPKGRGLCQPASECMFIKIGAAEFELHKLCAQQVLGQFIH